MGGQLAGGYYRLVGNHLVRSAVVQDADDATILHGFLCQVAHALASSFTIEILSFQLGQCHTNLLDVGDGLHSLALVVHKLGDVDGDVTTVTLCPSFLPKVASDLGNLINYRFQSFAAFQNTFHIYLNSIT